MLRATAVLGAVAYVPNVYAAYLDGAFLVVLLDTVVLGIVVGLMLARRMAFVLRAALLVAVWYPFAGLLIWVVGPIGSGIARWLGAPTLATLFFGTPGARWGVALSVMLGALEGLGFAIDAAQGVVRWAPTGYSLPDWIGVIASVSVLSALLLLLIVRLLEGLGEANRTLHEANDKLRAEAAARRELEQALVEAAESRALASLAGSVAHDLNNLLVPLLAAGTDARDATQPGSVDRRRLDLVVGPAQRARALAHRVLVFRPDSSPERAPVALADVARDAFALLEVVDNGVGIPSELVDRVCDPSYTSHADVGASGMGLTIVRHVARALGGRVDVRSEVGRGSVFTVWLPIAVYPTEPQPTRPPAWPE